MGFGSKWMSWMKGSVFSISVSVLVNRSPTDEFKASRGLLQGDTLSPFLFLLVAEGLAGMMRNVVSLGSFKGFKVADGIQFEMLQFADDTVLTCDGSSDNLWCIKSLLRGFELVSGIRINLNKSKLYGIHLEDHVVNAASSFLSCQVEKIPFIFLGIPVGGNHRRRDLWARVMENLKTRLGGWRGKCISLGGKVTLLNSMFNSIPIFMLSSSKLPSVWWRLSLRFNGIFYGGKEMVVGKCVGLGDVASFRFWDDCWLGPTPLKILFPRLFEVCESNSVKVANMGGWTNNGWVWDVGMDTNV
ncbi:uncharacterized protein LOC131630412 [Vicia villosa]|uniref:uncharacterized protein LOC131630412 n=1 Tax=Vicia villosa TaxID=3911 RepID=UPI00273BF13F|nr:uncharacterized protein LOC131630412 [Vicia villosa]